MPEISKYGQPSQTLYQWKYLKFKIAVMNFQLSLFRLKILGKERKEECISLSKSCKHAHLFCVLPHGFPGKRETARSFKPRLCYVAFCFLPLIFICKQNKKKNNGLMKRQFQTGINLFLYLFRFLWNQSVQTVQLQEHAFFERPHGNSLKPRLSFVSTLP